MRIRENASLGRKETIMTTANTMTTTSVTKPIPRRTMLGGMAGAGALSVAWPYLARAQQGDINIGVLLPFTGSQGAYGPDMRKAADLTTKIVNDAGGVLGGRKFKLFFEDDESNPPAALASTKNLPHITKCLPLIRICAHPIPLPLKPAPT